MALDDLPGRTEEKPSTTRDKLIGVFIGILAVVLAICSMGGDNAAKDAAFKNIEASNTWAFFQAKNARRQGLRLQADQLEIMTAAQPTMADDAKQSIAARVADYRTQADKLTSDPERKEGLDELWVKGKALEAERDDALNRGPYFDYGQALLQIAIVLASIAIISGGNALLIGSFVLGGLGALSTVGGFTQAFPMPFAG
ncbi:MAG: DUF4337 domain-containing protein [Hyphomicrobium sp.]